MEGSLARKPRIGWRVAGCLCCALLPLFVIPLILIHDGAWWETTDWILHLALFGWPVAAFAGVVGARTFRAAVREDATRKGANLVATALLVVTCLCLMLAVFAFLIRMTARPGMPNESTAVANLRTIHGFQQEFRSARTRYGSIPDLVSADLLDKRFRATVSGYRFNIYLTDSGYVATAVAEPRRNGRYDYFINNEGLIHFSPDPDRAPPDLAGQIVQ
jgi:hypothetical protein